MIICQPPPLAPWRGLFFCWIIPASPKQAIKKRDRQSGGHRAVSHFQIRDGGIRGDRSPLIQSVSSEGGHAQLATVLRDNATSTLDYSLIRAEAAQPIRGFRAATRPIDSSGAALRRPRTPSYTHGAGAKQLASASLHRVSVESKKRSLTHPADERSNQRWSGYGEGATIAVIETIGNLGAVYLAFKAADLVLTYFVIRFIWRRRSLIRIRPKQRGVK
jgi:hypothetical protein